MQPVVKNLLIINLLFFLATIVFERQGIFLIGELGLFYPDSYFFEPYQIATHFFMHSGFRHILFNMLALVVFGSMLERVWGAKRFLIFYFVTAIGAAFLHMLVGGIELYNTCGSFFPISDDVAFNSQVAFDKAVDILNSPAVGASGAIFGLLMGAAMYFPNTEVMLYFAIRVKIKWLALGAGVYEVITIIQNNPFDRVAHFAHIGGALFGFILIKIWQRNKANFY